MSDTDTPQPGPSGDTHRPHDATAEPAAAPLPDLEELEELVLDAEQTAAGEAGLDHEAAAETADATGPRVEPDTRDEEIARLREENAAMKDRALRALAEAENIRRRAQKEKEDTAKFAVSSFARDVLTVADNLARSVEAVPADRADDPVFANMRDGLSAVDRELHGMFERHGIVRVDPMGQKFDPNYHQAMFEVPTTDQVPGTVVQVMQAGYVLNGRLLRPAMVGVAKGEPPQKIDTEA